MIIPSLLVILAVFQAAIRSSIFFLTLLHAAFFSFALYATYFDFTHSLLINSIFCLFLAQYCSKNYDTLLAGVYIGLQFIAVLNYFCMAVFYSFLTEFYTQAITLYNSLNDMLIILNIAVLVGMTDGGSWLRNYVK